MWQWLKLPKRQEHAGATISRCWCRCRCRFARPESLRPGWRPRPTRAPAIPVPPVFARLWPSRQHDDEDEEREDAQREGELRVTKRSCSGQAGAWVAQRSYVSAAPDRSAAWALTQCTPSKESDDEAQQHEDTQREVQHPQIWGAHAVDSFHLATPFRRPRDGLQRAISFESALHARLTGCLPCDLVSQHSAAVAEDVVRNPASPLTRSTVSAGRCFKRKPCRVRGLPMKCEHFATEHGSGLSISSTSIRDDVSHGQWRGGRALQADARYRPTMLTRSSVRR